MRIRTIKPEFWSSPDVDGMSPWARLLYIAMWNWADDHGRGTANPKELAAFAFPHDDQWTSAELPTLLTEIHGRFGVVFYRVGGRSYYAIPTWERHQRNERRAQSKYPAPEEGVPYFPGPSELGKQPNSPTETAGASESVGNSDATHGSSGPGTGEQGNRGTEKKTSSSSARKRGTRIPDDFAVTPEMVEWARERVPHVDGRTETEKFINYWRSKSGSGATKLDWAATWRNWMLNAAERAPSRASPASQTDANIARLLGNQPQLRAISGGDQ